MMRVEYRIEGGDRNNAHVAADPAVNQVVQLVFERQREFAPVAGRGNVDDVLLRRQIVDRSRLAGGGVVDRRFGQVDTETVQRIGIAARRPVGENLRDAGLARRPQRPVPLRQ
jgi:hypothetical protein